MVEVRADAVEAMAGNIRDIAASFRKLNAPGGLTEDAIITLVHRDCRNSTVTRDQM